MMMAVALLRGDASIAGYYLRAFLLIPFVVYPLSRAADVLVGWLASRRSAVWIQILKTGAIKAKDMDLNGTGWEHQKTEVLTMEMFSYGCWVGTMSTLGGLLCLPRVLNLPGGAGLAAYGLSIELAWEIADTISRSLDLVLPGGRRRAILRSFTLVMCHHSLCICIMPLAASLYFDTVVPVCFVLQFFAGLATIVDLYCQTLDVATQRGLKSMYWMTFFSFFILTLGRFAIGYTIIVYIALRAVRQRHVIKLVSGVGVLGVFSYAAHGFINAGFRKLKKYHELYYERTGKRKKR